MDYLHLAVYTAAVTPLAYWIVWCVYSLYFHPLARYPGPKLAAVSEIWYARTWAGGKWPFVLKGLHRQYGSIVRISPNELSFSSAQFFKDIYGQPSKSRKLFPKSKLFYDYADVANIAYERDPEKHAAKRKPFASSFSTRALGDQEHIIHEHTDTLLRQLKRLSAESDLSGDLAFGEPFGAVREAKSHYWVSLPLGAIYGSSAAGLEKPYTVAFSIGPQGRVGINLAYMEMRIILAKIAFSLDWELVGEPGYWPDTCQLTQFWKKALLPMKFYPRRDKGK